MSCDCPTCGQALPVNDELQIDPAGIVVRRGRFAVLPLKELEILQLLQGRPGHLVSRDKIEGVLWPNEADRPHQEVIESHVSKLRKKVAPLGLTIEGAPRGVRAYRLLIKQGEAA